MKRIRKPPAIATWLLYRLAGSYRRDALIGDLSEEYQRRGSRIRYWREVLSAIAVGMRGALLRGWGLGALRLLMIGGMLIGASCHQKWPMFLMALDPSLYFLLHRAARKHRATQMQSNRSGRPLG